MVFRPFFEDSPFVVGRGIFLLGDNIPDDMRFLYASQFLVKALKGKDEFLMIHPKEVKHGGMKIPNVDRVFYHVIAEVIRFAIVHASLDSPACEPTRETTRVMVATIVFPGYVSLPVNGASEFAHEDDQRIIEQSAQLEVLEKGGGGLIDVLALSSHVLGQT